MQPHMSAKEADLFLALVRNSRLYVEFGVGGSTYVASQHADAIVCVDSSVEWLDKVQAACAPHKTRPHMLPIDIGPTGEWGYPLDPATKPAWPSYYESVWNVGNSRDGDLYMIDGRFRVACFAMTVLNCRPDALIGFHDFARREPYHVVRRIAREVATAENLSIFLPTPGAQEAARELLAEHRFTTY